RTARALICVRLASAHKESTPRCVWLFPVLAYYVLIATAREPRAQRRVVHFHRQSLRIQIVIADGDRALHAPMASGYLCVPESMDAPTQRGTWPFTGNC
ncbi:MAG: hypothetical protein L0H63_08675, partial [Nitrococcus sp.]|nr:hypothetical protein [Nitrococcus sp.]